MRLWAKASDVCGVLLDPPTNAVVWSVDEKSGMQAKSRVDPTKPAVPGKPARREFEYNRNGTAVLFAALDVHDGGIAGWVTDSTRSENFVDFFGDLVRQTPKGLDLHCIADNLSAHKTGAVASFLDKNPHVHIHYTPTHADSLNQVELFFSILERRLLRGASSLPSKSSPIASSPSSRTTTEEPPRSAGPTTASPYESRKSQ